LTFTYCNTILLTHTHTYMKNNKNNKKDNGRLYKFGADYKVQEDAMERIHQIAREADLQVIMISNEDFELRVHNVHGEDEEHSKRLPYTVQDCANFKNGVMDSLMSNWGDCESDVFEQLFPQAHEEDEEIS
jgi:hypothetical protein